MQPLLAALILLGSQAMTVQDLPVGTAPAPVAIPHFPDRLHAFVWRNWTLVPLDRIAQTVGASPEQIKGIGRAMGLPDPPRISKEVRDRAYLTVIKRNWHLLPYDQLLTLLDWKPEQMAFTLREDDFFYVKLGSHKPKCEPLKYALPNAAAIEREKQIAGIVHGYFGDTAGLSKDPLFSFVKQLSTVPPNTPSHGHPNKPPSPRYCYSYFALYGDPLLETHADPYPEGLLSRLAKSGADGVWLQAVLYKLAPFPWEPSRSENYEKRLANLRALVARAKKHGIGIYLYFNEPRAMPLSFFKDHPDLKGVTEGEFATLCTSVPEVRKYIRDSVATICRAVPDLAGIFTITASENLTNCWSHHRGAECPRCTKRPPAEVIAEVNTLVQQGIRDAGASTRLIAWDWGWRDSWALDAIRLLPREAYLQSVSEWDLPIERGGVKTTVGEYSISSIGPGPRAQRHWAEARKRGLRVIAKIQAGNTWEISTVPYIPALENVAQHGLNLKRANVDGLMLGWTLGGYPSPNLEAISEAFSSTGSPDDILQAIALRRVGHDLSPHMATAWKKMSAAFREFPYHISVAYSAPTQLGPANLLWAEPTRYPGTMVGFPYDDLDQWRGPYPPDVFIRQWEKMADGFEDAVTEAGIARTHQKATAQERKSYDDELSIGLACAAHFRSVANQCRFIVARRELAAKSGGRQQALKEMRTALESEIDISRRLYRLQVSDSRLGFEASNQYAYVPLDLVEKALNCSWLLEQLD